MAGAGCIPPIQTDRQTEEEREQLDTPYNTRACHVLLRRLFGLGMLSWRWMGLCDRGLQVGMQANDTVIRISRLRAQLQGNDHTELSVSSG